MPYTLLDKIWAAHEVQAESSTAPAVLYIDLHLAHEISTPQAFELLRTRGLRVRRPDRTIATLDHITPTALAELQGLEPFASAAVAHQIGELRRNTADHGIELFDLQDARRGIVHVIGPELGLTQPGMTIVCGDSHTSTHGAFGALAFGIGTTEIAHVLATQCLLQRKPRAIAINVAGDLGHGVTAKDLILAIIGNVGTSGGVGAVFEYRGRGITQLSMEQRMTVCNMSIEAGARAGLVAPDETTFAYLQGLARVPVNAAWEQAVARWSRLCTDVDARFDAEIAMDASALEPMITYGTNPGMSLPIGGTIPQRPGDATHAQALRYMGFEAGDTVLGKPIDVVFIGSCTNGRLEDLRAAAQILRNQKVAKGVRMLAVPGSQQVKSAAEAEGLADVFRAAGAEWRESGCSMCLGLNGDTVGAGKYAVSTSNRNFEGRQGVGARTLLASPYTAAASAVAGRVADPRLWIGS
jgi:3-isopropylmalate/(R)-2-methylmalate dehydratase large subunit